MQRFCTRRRKLPAPASLALMAALIPTLVAAQPPARHSRPLGTGTAASWGRDRSSSGSSKGSI